MSIQNCIILAAGAGQRLGGDHPKAMARVAGKSLIEHFLAATQDLGLQKTIVVVGHQHEQLRSHLKDSPAAVGHRIEWVLQESLKGTGHAAFCALPALMPDVETVLIGCADHPLHRPKSLNRFLDQHRRSGLALTIMTYRSPTANGCGRVIRDESGELLRIMERHDPSYADAATQELNAGMYAVALPFLKQALTSLTHEEVPGEHYLTWIIEYAHREGRTVGTFPLDDSTEALGVNTPDELARVAEVFLRRTLVTSGAN